MDGPPDFAELGTPVAIAGLTGFFHPMLPVAGATDLTCSVYKPGLHIWWRGQTQGLRPGVLFVHGGGWSSGSPAAHVRHMHELAARGYVAAALQYRLSNEARWPAPLADVLAAVAWLRAHHNLLGLDPDRIVLSGGSAGGHLAAMAALLPTTRAAAAVLWYPVVDLRTFDANPDTKPMTDALAPPNLLAASPIAHVTSQAPPVLTMTGDRDLVADDVRRFHARLDEASVRNELVVYPGRDHGFDFHPTDWQDCFDRMMAFLGPQDAG